MSGNNHQWQGWAAPTNAPEQAEDEQPQSAPATPPSMLYHQYEYPSPPNLFEQVNSPYPRPPMTQWPSMIPMRHSQSRIASEQEGNIVTNEGYASIAQQRQGSSPSIGRQFPTMTSPMTSMNNDSGFQPSRQLRPMTEFAPISYGQRPQPYGLLSHFNFNFVPPPAPTPASLPAPPPPPSPSLPPPSPPPKAIKTTRSSHTRKRAKPQRSGKPLDKAKRNLRLYRELRDANGVWSEAKGPTSQLQRNPGGKYPCPICGKDFRSRDNLKWHFATCVSRHGNPNAFCWNEDLKQKEGEQGTEERGYLRRRRQGEVLTRLEYERLELLRSHKINELQAEVEKLEQSEVEGVEPESTSNSGAPRQRRPNQSSQRADGESEGEPVNKAVAASESEEHREPEAGALGSSINHGAVQQRQRRRSNLRHYQEDTEGQIRADTAETGEDIEYDSDGWMRNVQRPGRPRQRR